MSLGPARLLATVLTGRVVSKSDGGQFAATQFPGFAEHIDRVLHARQQPDTSPTSDRDELRRALELAQHCVDLGTTT